MHMSIPETQLETWARQGATASSAAIYHRISSALEAAPELAGREVRIYLQGSYRNDTNIRGDSDVDIVAELRDTFYSNKEELPPDQYRLHEQQHSKAAYQLADFRRDVTTILRQAFPSHQIQEGAKSIKIPRTNANIPADVVPCCAYREYGSFFGIGVPQTKYTEGIWLFDVKRNQSVIGFPKQHFENGVAKNGVTNNWFKPTVRVFKNIRSLLEDSKLLPEGVASSNHIECLVYNVPVGNFGGSYSGTMRSSLQWLIDAELNKFVCVNGQRWLFGPDQWSQENAKRFVATVVDLWNEWGRNALLRV